MSTSFIKNTSKLLAGNAIGQLIGIIAIPIITRLYSVEVYGEFSSLLAISLILATLSTLSLHLAILIPKSEAEASKIFKLSLSLTYIFCLFISIVLYFFNEQVVSLLNIKSNSLIVYSIPVLVLLQSLYVTITYLGVRVKVFGQVSTSKVIEGISDRGIAILSGFSGFVFVGNLILARVASSVLAIMYLLPTLKRFQGYKKTAISNGFIVTKYKRYLQYNTPSMLLINSMLQLPVIIIAAYFSSVAAGLFAIANRLVNIPVTALGSAISKTFMQKIAEDKANDDMGKIKKNTDVFFTILVAFLLIPFSVLAVIGDSFFVIALGEKWADAGVLASFLSYFAMTTLLVQAFGGLFDVMNKQYIRLIFHVVNFIVRIGTLLLCIYLDYELAKTVLIYAIAATLMNVVAMGLLLRCVQQLQSLIFSLFSNIIPFILFHGLAAIVMCYLESILVTYSLITVLAILWFFMIGGMRKLKQFRK
ncbi:lipopolysaccharide biosynthesis protein [Pseudoalteromonas denitrificans]|uniref:Membrane protein involved in the export of O-antigen and teichoic acid n=1 Tax=Pseudoalteromonas denitrificans DSM 6059 TaxID=1123010 RepID=A0A1I1FFH8_9GAMM|nr:lipopolysaccharide biosynthesis protein [Pseudoalteromonas denitrificans]SFB95883.1 Membrane protein involved in the export of O-antigen and teichoic acid [Pseudoalteromonas denitrificans DSM 6059]